MLIFIFSAVAISLSGVLAPGPITAATLSAGSQRRDAGVLIALGHMLIELPLILLLAAGLGTHLVSPVLRATIGLAGGGVLLWMGLQLLRSLRSATVHEATSAERHPLLTGVILTAANPYFLIWWATVGLALTSQALHYGLLALVLFAIVHWLCDLVWLMVLSWAGFKGTEVFGSRMQTIVSASCGVVLLGFGLKFLVDSGLEFLRLG